MEPTSVSFLASLWPVEGSKEEEYINAKMQLPMRGKPQGFKLQYQKMLTLAQVMFTVGESAAEAMTTSRYKRFDALMKNFGCQITALDVQKKLKNKALFEEAVKVAALCKEKLALAQEKFNKPKLGECGQTFLQYCRHAGLDFQVSKEFSDLVAYRFLQIVNDTKLVRDEEVPVTNVDPLERIKNTLSCRATGPLFSFDTWVHGIQAKESEKSVRFIQQVAANLPESGERTMLMRRMLGDEHVRRAGLAKSSQIAATAQLYSGEAVLRSMKGVLVVKNKLFLNGERMQKAQKDVVFMHMPEGKILHDDEVKRLKPTKPVVVLEGYCGPRPLVETLDVVGVITLLNVNLATLPQYTSGFGVDPPEAYEDIESFAEKRDIIKHFRADHMFCSSVEVERDG